jgi:hypothetical protein
MSLPVKVCEMATLLIRTKGRIIQTRKRRFGRVPYGGLSLTRARSAPNVTNAHSDCAALHAQHFITRPYEIDGSRK